jgi:prepilin-type N-terminal cleavage/methylation domain-containing protein
MGAVPRMPALSAPANRVQNETRQRGFTLIELMIVVALLATVAGMGVWSLSGSIRNQQVSEFARSVEFAMIRARSETIADNFQRRMSCTATACQLQIASTTGMGAPPQWNNGDWKASGGSQSQVWAIDTNTDIGTTNPGGGPLAAAKTVTFFPDGTATPATIFVQDVRGIQKYKVFVYRATGMARIVDSW